MGHPKPGLPVVEKVPDHWRCREETCERVTAPETQRPFFCVRETKLMGVFSEAKSVWFCHRTVFWHQRFSGIQHWNDSRGGLSPRMIFLRGRQLEAMYRPCYLDARVAAPR